MSKKQKIVQLIANGDLRLAANQKCWPAQRAMEAKLTAAIEAEGYHVVRAHSVRPAEKHGFISSQKEGLDVFRHVDPKLPIIVAEAVWQYSHHVMPGLMSHKAPILTVANWSGTWPGLVGMLNLNGSLTKAGVDYSTLWSEAFEDKHFTKGLKHWLKHGVVEHDVNHVTPFADVKVPHKVKKIADGLAADLLKHKAIMGVFDEGCMGMFNAIVPDDLLNATGVFKERLSQSGLYYETTRVTDREARDVFDWFKAKGLAFQFGTDEATELTEAQVLAQCKTYVAAVRIADDFGCATIGIQYQQGLKDLLPASDLVEGTLNNVERPPVKSRDGKRTLYAGQAIPHFNEVDECAGLDGLLTNRVHAALGQPVENTLHDLRWGDVDRSGTTDAYVWVFLISGSAPPAHFIDGWAGAKSYRQPAMYFRLGGGTLCGISRPGELIWSRIYIENNKLKMDLGRGEVLELPPAETERRWRETTPQWPIMHAVTYGVSRDQMMARHKANHIQCAYANSAAEADHAMLAKAQMAASLGIHVAICGTRKGDKAWS